VAGSRRRRLLDRVVAALDRDGWQVSVLGTTGPGNATVLAARAVLAGNEMVAAAGGDGTINEVVAGMRESGLPLGVIPMGTANVLAAEMDLPRRPEAIAASFAAGARRPLHLPEIDGAPFLLMAGAGFDGAVVAAVSPGLKRRYGKGAFILQGLRRLVTGPAERIVVAIDGVPHMADWVVVTNISRYGGSYRLAPDADAGAPALTAVVFRDAGRQAMLNHFLHLALGTLDRSPLVDFIPAVTVELSNGRGSTASLVQVDGDTGGALPRRITATNTFIDIIVSPPR
tara:strand:+ start:551 stop:1405 length:855 start_codon:yes stop_codon:yes gene_type:complete